MTNQIKAIIHQISKETIELEFHGQIIKWPKELAPKHIQIGDEIQLALICQQKEKKDRELLAQEILNQIFKQSKEND